MNAPNYREANTFLLDCAKRAKVMVAAHRGSHGGSIIENTTGAFECAIRQGADIVELDVIRSTDGKLFVFHDGNEERLLGVDRNIKTMSSQEILSYRYRNGWGKEVALHVNLLEDVFSYLKGRCLINVDRAWEIWDSVLPCIEACDVLPQCLVKSDPVPELLRVIENYEAPILYMSKAFHAQDVDNVLRRKLNLVAFELIFFDEDSELLDSALQSEWKDKGLLLWANALRLRDDWNRSAWKDDHGAIMGNPDDHWGWLADHGFDMIQTDWPQLLRHYLDNRAV